MLGDFVRFVGRALRFTFKRPIQRFNIANRAKRYTGPDSKYFSPAPRAIGPLSKEGPKRYGYLESGGGPFKSIQQRRLEALAKRNKQLLEQEGRSSSFLSIRDDEQPDPQEIKLQEHRRKLQLESKSFSEIKRDDELVIALARSLPTVRTTDVVMSQARNQLSAGEPRQGAANTQKAISPSATARPLPKNTHLDMEDPRIIWAVDRVPQGRLDLNKLQELMFNKLADHNHWTSERIAEHYDIKLEYAEKLVKYLKQIRVVLSPRQAYALEYAARNDPIFQATRHVIYHVDKRLRTKTDRMFDGTFLPEDELDPEIRDLIDPGAIGETRESDATKLKKIFKRPEPLQIGSLNKPKRLDEQRKLPVGKQMQTDMSSKTSQSTQKDEDHSRKQSKSSGVT